MEYFYVLMIAMMIFFMGFLGGLKFERGHSIPTTAIIQECEKQLPRNQKCVAQAIAHIEQEK